MLNFNGTAAKQQRQKNDNVVVDCHYTLSEALAGIKIPPGIKKDLRIIDVRYYSFDGRLHEGQLVIHKDLAEDIKKIFREIEEHKFPVQKVIPIVAYGWSDDSSMKDNNTSAFNYRNVEGTDRLSNHSYGRAIDINPWLNPQIKKDKVLPEGAVYNPGKRGTITKGSFLVKLFLKLGWDWGGNWHSSKDYQHFEKLKN